MNATMACIQNRAASAGTVAITKAIGGRSDRCLCKQAVTRRLGTRVVTKFVPLLHFLCVLSNL
jgi:hypothetical protein